MASFFKELIFGPEKRANTTNGPDLKNGYNLKSGLDNNTSGKMYSRNGNSTQKPENSSKNPEPIKTGQSKPIYGYGRNTVMGKELTANVFGDEKISKTFNLYNRQKKLSAGAAMFGGMKERVDRRTVIKIGDLAAKRRYSEIKGLDPKMVHKLNNSAEARKLFQDKITEITGYKNWKSR